MGFFDFGFKDILGPAVSLFGGELNREAAGDARASNEQMNRENQALQREFAQNGIRWRVEDAKAAGIHPVYALSGGGAAYAPSAITVNPDTSIGDTFRTMGQDLSRAAASQETAEQREARRVANEVALSQINRNNAEADMFRSTTIRNHNQVVGSPTVGDPNLYADPAASAAAPGSNANQVKLEPSKATSYSGSDPSVAAARDVFWKEFKVSRDRHWWLPNADSASEAMESVSESWPLTWMVIRENMQRNPYFWSENRHLIPFGNDAHQFGENLARVVEAMEQAYQNGKVHWDELGHRDSNWIERSGRDRGVNWRKNKGLKRY